jgi:leucine dehydrogenase
MVETAENKKVTSNLLATMSLENHEQVMHCYDKATGLKAIIAIHNTVLGPALGGTRFWNYTNESEALNDVLRLSRGMTYKSAISGLNLGGGKAVIVGDPSKLKNEALMRRFGKFVDNLGGKYITAEDVGVDTRDMEYIRMETKHVTGLPEWMGGGGNPSPVTGYGVYMGIKAAASIAFGNDTLSGKTIGVQGIGHVGETVVKYLSKEGANVFITDINPSKLAAVSKEFGAEVVSDANAFYSKNMDIYVPCALGATVNSDTISKLKCAVIAGAANNQLADENLHSQMLLDRGIVYAPDFVINAGGIINVYSELIGYNREMALASAEKIYDTVINILKKSQAEKIGPQFVAMQLAQERINSVATIRQTR